MKVLVIDPKIAGIAGDMLLASLIDLTGRQEALDPLAEAIRKLPGCSRFECTITRVDSGGIAATRVSLDIGEKRAKTDGDLRASLQFIADEAALSPLARDRSLSVLDELLGAEARLHKTGFSRHEIASVDTLFDITGALLILDQEGFLEGSIVATPPALGGGYVRIDGGSMPGPAPLTIDLLARHRIRYASLPIDVELTTPTGVALLSVLAERIVDPYPVLTPSRVGYGTGHRPVPGRPDVLRVVEGESVPAGEDQMVMLETNLDDISGETIGYVVERLFEEGAVDVFIIPAFGKKNRPVSVISAMVTESSADRLIRVLMEETGSLGVRVREFRKVVAGRTRETVPVTIAGRQFEVRVKISHVNGNIFSRKPEFDDLRAIARELHLPLRSIEDEVRKVLPGSGKEPADPRARPGRRRG
jgi:uncharacterized protein (TIGR00299 family) protein